MEPLEYIKKLFYDIIIGVVGNLLSDLFRKEKKIAKELTYNHSHDLKPDEPVITVEWPSYNHEISERLLLTQKLMSSAQNKLTFSKICDYLGLESVSFVVDSFHGKHEPKLSLLKKYCDFFGIDWNWLRHGEGNVFSRYNRHETFAINYFKNIMEFEPEEILYVRSKDESGTAGIILRLTNHKFLVLPSTYNISSMVGGTGQAQIVSFHSLVLELSKSHLRFKQNGLKVGKEEFADLFQGKVYPGKYFNCYRIYDHWWDDLLDYNHKYPIAEEYHIKHGEEFIKAQEIIRGRRCA